jgi:heptose II phosphotransferase
MILNNLNKKTDLLILHERRGQWRIQWKNDGFDYQSLLNLFLAGEIKGQRLATETHYRTIYKVEYAGRLFVIKRDLEKDHRLEKRLWFFLAGTFYSRLIRLTAQAINNGCQVLQDVYLVSERMEGRLCQEAYVIAEYVPGQSFMREIYEEGQPVIFLRPGDNLALIAEALETLHSFGLASNDAKISNFVLTDSKKIKIIDLSTNTPILLAKVNDILQMRKTYQTEVPINNWLVKILTRIMSWHWRLKHRLRVWRKRVPAERPSKIWADLPSLSQDPSINNSTPCSSRSCAPEISSYPLAEKEAIPKPEKMPERKN